MFAGRVAKTQKRHLDMVRGEIPRAVTLFQDWWFASILFLVLLLFVLAAQIPFQYTVEVGQEDGPGGDLPIVSGFWPPERDTHGSFRWTRDQAEFRFPGVGQRPLQVSMRVFPVNDEVAQRGPQVIEVWMADRLIGTLPVRPQGATYQFTLPPPSDSSGDHVFSLQTATFVPTGDERAIGTPVDTITVSGIGGPILPAWQSLLWWLLAVSICWVLLRLIGFASHETFALLFLLVMLLGLAALLDPPRVAFGAWPAVVALTLGGVVVLVLRTVMPMAAQRFRIPLGADALRWLLLLSLAVFSLRYGGKIYPDSMPGDIGFHSNRYDDLVRGTVLLLSRNRGVDFPYPTALYLLLAPFSLLGFPTRVLLQVGAAIMDAISPFLIYAIAAQPPRRNEAPLSHESSFPVPLIAAGIYSLSAAGFMTTWWNFSTHIFAQFVHLLFMTALILWWRGQASRQLEETTSQGGFSVAWLAVLGLVVFQSFVYLGHFGFWMNMALLGSFIILILFVVSMRTKTNQRHWRTLFAGFVVAMIISVLFFYSAYTGMFVDQAIATATGGLTGLAERDAVPFDVLWTTLWDAGFRVHFGFLPVPLALAGLAFLWQRYQRTTEPPELKQQSLMMPLLMTGTFLIATFFAVLPFLSGSTLSTRWLMFSAWAIAVSSAFAARYLWYTGRAGQIVVWMAGSYILWITLSQWLAALAWRVRPPEPF